MEQSTPVNTDDDFFLPDLCAVERLGVLLLVSQLVAIVIVLSRHGLWGFDWQDFALVAFFAVWVVLLSAAILCRFRPALARLAPAAGAAAVYLLILGVTVLVSLGGQFLAHAGVPLAARLQLEDTLVHVLIAGIVAGIMLRHLYLQQQLRRQQQAELRARLSALQSRIRPHFLFNSLNIIASLIDTAPDKAEQAVEDLSALFRASLAEADTEVTVTHELDLCRRYLALEQLRFGDRLRVRWDTEGLPTFLPVPLLTLQPLLENAVNHGIQTCPDGGTVTVRGEQRDGEVHWQVTNPVGDTVDDSTAGNRMALENTRHRLQALYGSRADIRFSRSDGWAAVHLHYPVTTEAAPA